MRRTPLQFSFIFLLFFSFVNAQDVSSQTKNERVSSFIELSNVPEASAKINNDVEKIRKEFTENKNIIYIHNVLPEYAKSVNQMLTATNYNDLQDKKIRNLEKLNSELNIYDNELKQWKSSFKERINIYDINRKRLETYSQIWAQTHINAENKAAPNSIKEQIANVIIEIENLRSKAKVTYDLLLIDSNTINTIFSQVQEKRHLIKKTKSLRYSRVLYQNDAPLTKMFFTESFSPLSYLNDSFQQLSDKVDEFLIYHELHNSRWVYMFLGSFLIISFISYFFLLYKKKELFVSSVSLNKKDYFFIGKPISTAIILLALFSLIVFFDSPYSVREILVLLILLPVFRIIGTVFDNEIKGYFYVFFILNIFSFIERNFIDNSLDDRVLNAILSLLLIFLIRSFWKHNIVEFVQSTRIKGFIYKLLPLTIFFLVVSILANIYGATQLSQQISHGIYQIIQASILLLAFTIILSGYVIVLLRRRISTASNILDKYAYKIETSVTLIIRLFMTFWLLKVAIRLLGIDPYLDAFMDYLLGLHWIIGSTTFSLESLSSFAFILVGTWFTSRLIKVLLEVEVFARFQFSRGVPNAITTISNYFIIGTGILVSLSSLGISTEQFAIVFGALGVGIGFGLRNIIANFVSGLILVFERPIQIGDTVEVDNIMGEVLSIGARASSVKTFDGSEVIIPNEEFISSKVINWTLSDERRRKTLEIKVSFDSEINEVLDIMKEVAMSHDNVLKDPAPLSTFVGFGDYYLEFKLYFWLTENLIVAQSEIAINVYASLKKAGIKTGLPRQELIMNKEDET